MTWTEEELAAAAATGHPDAAGEISVRFRARVRRQVVHRLAGSAEVEDLVCEILEAAVETLRRGGFRGECRLSTFLHAIGRNRIAAHLRGRRPETEELTEALAPADPRPAPDESAARLETALAVRRALLDLKPKYREVLFLYYYRELTVAEIAAQLNVPAKVVSEWKDYALRQIRARYGPALRGHR